MNRIRKVCATLCLALPALSASANCAISYGSTTTVVEVLKDGFNFENYNLVCEKLRKAKAKVFISGDTGVLHNRSYGWASVYLADATRDFVVITNVYSNATKLSDFASDPTARGLLRDSINDALNNWNALDQALAELNRNRQGARKTTPK